MVSTIHGVRRQASSSEKDIHTRRACIFVDFLCVFPRRWEKKRNNRQLSDRSDFFLLKEREDKVFPPFSIRTCWVKRRSFSPRAVNLLLPIEIFHLNPDRSGIFPDGQQQVSSSSSLSQLSLPPSLKAVGQWEEPISIINGMDGRATLRMEYNYRKQTKGKAAPTQVFFSKEKYKTGCRRLTRGLCASLGIVPLQIPYAPNNALSLSLSFYLFPSP